MNTSRREFGIGALAVMAFSGIAARAMAQAPSIAMGPAMGYGPLIPDPQALLDLPKGFKYQIISRYSNLMDDGHTVPDAADGMGCFALPDGKIALVRNHELGVRDLRRGPLQSKPPAGFATYDSVKEMPVPGGTTTLVYDPKTGLRTAEWLSLVGTIRNCAGGITPWGSWLTCEEDVSLAGKDDLTRDHGWVFEVPASKRGLADPVPLKGLGRFNHEAAAVDPATGIVYLTEDRPDSLFYRFLPVAKGELLKGGRLQALALDVSDSRNFKGINTTYDVIPGAWLKARWIDLDGTDAPGQDDLRLRGAAKGATLFARGEGIWWGNGELFFTATSGGAAQQGQIFRYRPGKGEGRKGVTGQLQLFYESPNRAEYSYGDNLTIMPNGHLMVCEDQYDDTVDNHLRGITSDGRSYTFGRSRIQTETAGACFSPDGSTLFVNFYSPTMTLAITGPWAAVDSGAVQG